MNTDKAPIKKVDKRGLLYEELTYKIRGAMYEVHKALGPGHKEVVYQKALASEFESRKIPFAREKVLNVLYKDKKVGIYKPDFIVDNKVIIEIKAIPFLVRDAEIQMSYYLRGTQYELGLLVNFGSQHLDIRRRIYSANRR